MSKVIVKDIWAEDLFEWFYKHVMDSGGDGAAIICCGNPEETAEWFVKWWRESKNTCYKGEGFFHEMDEYERDGIRFINFHDCNENFIFCASETSLGFSKDYSFVVKEDCPSAFKKEWIIRALKS